MKRRSRGMDREEQNEAEECKIDQDRRDQDRKWNRKKGKESNEGKIQNESILTKRNTPSQQCASQESSRYNESMKDKQFEE